MGFLDKIFRGNEGGEAEQYSKAPWHHLESEIDLHRLEEESKEKVVVIFKHSTRCGISRMAKRQFESEYNYDEAQVKLYYLDLIAYRSVSNKVAEDFGVFHESPQLLIIKNKNVVYHTSHSDINAEKIAEFLD